MNYKHFHLNTYLAFHGRHVKYTTRAELHVTSQFTSKNFYGLKILGDPFFHTYVLIIDEYYNTYVINLNDECRWQPTYVSKAQAEYF